MRSCQFFIFLVIVMGGHSKDAKFRVKLVVVQSCKLPQEQMDPDQPLISSHAVRKISRETAVVDTNITSVKRFGPVTFSCLIYQLQQNAHRDLVAKLEDAPCTNPVFRIAARLHINIDKDCYMMPKQYIIKDFDIDNFAMLVTQSIAQPGRYGFDIQFSTPKGVAGCAFVVCDITLRKK